MSSAELLGPKLNLFWCIKHSMSRCWVSAPSAARQRLNCKQMRHGDEEIGMLRFISSAFTISAACFSSYF